MRSTISITAMVLIIFMGAVAGFSATEGLDNLTWSQSYVSYRSDIKPMPKKEKNKCEKLLKEILRDLDTKNNCSVDEDCTLMSQEPFGDTVPILKKHARGTESKMKKYNDTCVDHSIHFVPNKELVKQ